MADDIQSNIRINVDTASAMDSIRLLQNQISAFHTQMSKMGAASAADSRNLQQNLINSINSTSAFSANMVRVRTTAEQFTHSLEKNKLTMGEYFRYAGGASKTFGKLFKSEFDTINKVARERVKDLQSQYIKLGRDANGAMQAIKVRPLSLDMQNLGTKTQIAAQRQQLLNQLLKQGSTNLLNFGKNTQWAGRQLMVGFTIPLSIMGGAAMKAYQQIEEASIKLKRVYGDLGTTTAETNKMVEQVKQLALEYTKYGVAVKDSMDMAATAAATGKKGADLIAQVNSATKLSVLGGVDQQKALQTTISLTNAFNISSKDLAKNINFLNAVENQTVLNIDDMTTAIPKAAPVIQQLGGDVKDLAFFLTAMKEGGVNASEGANALKSGLASLINPTNTASKMLAGFGINIKGIVEKDKGDLKKTVVDFAQALDTLDPLNRARAIEQLFGKFQFARMSTLFKNVIAQGSQASEVLKLAGQSSLELSMLSQKELNKISESPLYKFQKAIADFQAQLAPVGEQFMKAITPIINFGTDVLKNFNGLGEGVKGFIVKFVAVAGIVGPVLLMSFGLIANAVANVIKGFALMKDVFNRTGKSSLSLGEQVNYMTQEQIQAAAIASSLDQVHSKLKQTFTSEAAAVDILTAAYERSVAAQRAFAVPITPRGPVRKYATGGFISGPGTGTSDSIHAMLSNGEAVIPAKSVSQNKDLVQSLINNSLPRFSAGGIVGNPSESLMQQVKGTSAVIAYGAHQPFTSAHQGIAQRGMSMAEESGMPFFQFTSNQGKARRSVLGDDLKSRMISEAIGRNPEFAKNPFELMAILSKAGIKDVNILLGEDRMKSPVWEAAAKEFGITITKTGIPRPVGSPSGTMARAAAASGNIGMFESLLASGMSKSTKSEIFKSLFSAATGRGRKFSNGGMISGPGSGTSDSILAMVSNGEAIIPASSVARNPGIVRQLISENIPRYKFGKTGKYAGEQMSLPGGAELAHFSESVSMSASELLDSAKAQGATQAELNKIIAASQNDLDKKLKSFDSRVERVSKEFNQGVGETGTGKSIPKDLAYRDLVERGRDARSPIIDRMIKNGVSPDAALAAADEITKKVKANLDGLGKEVKITAEEVNRITDNAYEAVAETNPDIKSALDQQKKISNYKDESGDRGAKGQRRGFGKYSFIKQRNYLKNLPAKLGFDTAYGASAFKTTQEMEDISGMTGREISNSFKKLTPEQKIKVHAELKNGAEAFVKALMNETGQAVVQGVKDSTKQASPSKEAHTAGANIGKGAVQGIQSQVDDAKKAGTQVGTAAAQGVSQSGRVAGQGSRRASSEGNLIFLPGQGYVSEGQIARDQALANAPMIGPREGTRLEKLKAGMSANSIYRNIQKADTDKLAGGIRNKAFGASGAMALGSMVVPGEAGQMMGMASMLTSFSGMGAGGIAKGMKLLSKETIGLGLKFLKFVPYLGIAITAFEIFDTAIVPLIKKNAEAYKAIADTLNITQERLDKINNFFGTEAKLTGIRTTVVASGDQTKAQGSIAEQFQQSDQFKETYQESAKKMATLSDKEFKRAMEAYATDLFGMGYEPEAVKAIVDAIAIEAKKTSVSIAPEFFSLDDPKARQLMNKNIDNILNDSSKLIEKLNSQFSSSGEGNILAAASGQYDNFWLAPYQSDPEDIAKIEAAASEIGSYISALSGQFQNGTLSAKDFTIQYDNLIAATKAMPGNTGIEMLIASVKALNPELAKALELIHAISGNSFGISLVTEAASLGIARNTQAELALALKGDNNAPLREAAQASYEKAINKTKKNSEDIDAEEKKIKGVQKQSQGLANTEEKINEKYDKRISQLEKIKKLNDQIAKSQEGQLTLAEALNNGDIAAAAKAAVDIQNNDIQASLDNQQTGLDEARKAEVAPLKAAQEANTAAIDTLTNKIETLNKKTFEIDFKMPKGKEIKKTESEFGTDFLGIAGYVLAFIADSMGGTGQQTNNGLTPGDTKVEVVPKSAAGGHITGAGTGTSDSIPAMLSNGEYVIRANAVKTIGVDTLNKLNQADRLGFAAGGIVNAMRDKKPSRTDQDPNVDPFDPKSIAAYKKRIAKLFKPTPRKEDPTWFDWTGGKQSIFDDTGNYPGYYQWTAPSAVGGSFNKTKTGPSYYTWGDSPFQLYNPLNNKDTNKKMFNEIGAAFPNPAANQNPLDIIEAYKKILEGRKRLAENVYLPDLNKDTTLMTSSNPILYTIATYAKAFSNRGIYTDSTGGQDLEKARALIELGRTSKMIPGWDGLDPKEFRNLVDAMHSEFGPQATKGMISKMGFGKRYEKLINPPKGPSAKLNYAENYLGISESIPKNSPIYQYAYNYMTNEYEGSKRGRNDWFDDSPNSFMLNPKLGTYNRLGYANGGMVGYKDGGKIKPRKSKGYAGAWSTANITQESLDRAERNKLYKQGGFQGFEAGFNSWAQDLMGMPVLGDALKGTSQYLENDKITNFLLSTLSLPVNLIGGGVRGAMNGSKALAKGDLLGAATSGFRATGDAFASTYGNIFDSKNNYASQFQVAAQDVIDRGEFGSRNNKELQALARIIGGGLNVAADPLSYVGVGLAAKAGKVSSFTSKAGKGIVSAGTKVKDFARTKIAVMNAKKVFGIMGGPDAAALTPQIGLKMRQSGLENFISDNAYKTIHNDVKSSAGDTISNRLAIENATKMRRALGLTSEQSPAYGFLSPREAIPNTSYTIYPSQPSGLTPEESATNNFLRQVNPNSRPLQTYGSASISLKQSALKNATVSFGDTLSIFEQATKAGVKVPKVARLDSLLTTLKLNSLAKKTKGILGNDFSMPYAEVHLPGGFGLDDVREIGVSNEFVDRVPDLIKGTKQLLGDAGYSNIGVHDILARGKAALRMGGTKIPASHKFSDLFKFPVARYKSKAKAYTDSLLQKTNKQFVKPFVKPFRDIKTLFLAKQYARNIGEVPHITDLDMFNVEKKFSMIIKKMNLGKDNRIDKMGVNTHPEHIANELGINENDLDNDIFAYISGVIANKKSEAGYFNGVIRENEATTSSYLNNYKRETTYSADDIYLSLNEKFRGKGIAQKFTTQYIEILKKTGVNKINIDAGLTDGGYAWARAGFKFSERPTSLIERMKMAVGTVDDPKFLDLLDRLETAPVKDLPLPKEILKLKTNWRKYASEDQIKEAAQTLSDKNVNSSKYKINLNTKSLGELLLRGSSWKGSKDLVSPSFAERMKPMLNSAGGLGKSLLEKTRYLTNYKLPYAVKEAAGKVSSLSSLFAGKFKKAPYTKIDEQIGDMVYPTFKIGEKRFAFQGFEQDFSGLSDLGVDVVQLANKLDVDVPSGFVGASAQAPVALLEAALKLNPRNKKLLTMLNNFKTMQIGKKEINFLDRVAASLSIDKKMKPLEYENTEGFATTLSSLSGNVFAKNIIKKKTNALQKIMNNKSTLEKQKQANDWVAYQKEFGNYGDAADSSQVSMIHSSKYPIVRDKDGNVFLYPNGQFHPIFARPSIHFAAEDTVKSHLGGQWGVAENKIVSSLSSMIGDNGLPANLYPLDTWWMRNPGQPLKLSNVSVIRPFDNSKEYSDELVSRGLLEPGKMPSVITVDPKTKDVLYSLKPNYSFVDRVQIQKALGDRYPGYRTDRIQGTEASLLDELALDLAKKQLGIKTQKASIGEHQLYPDYRQKEILALAKNLGIDSDRYHTGNTAHKWENPSHLQDSDKTSRTKFSEIFESLRMSILKGHFKTEFKDLSLSEKPEFANGGMVSRYATGGFVMPSPEPIPTQYAMGGMVRAAMGGILLNGKMYGGFANGGMVLKKFAEGGYSMGTDTVPAMLTPGEFVIKKSAVDRIGTSTLSKINGYADGGMVGGTSAVAGDSVYNSNTYEINVNVSSNSNPDQIANAVMTKIRQIDNGRVRGLNG